MSVVSIPPYIGPKYRGGHRRLLLVGDSHYGWPSVDLAESTPTVVRLWQEGDWDVRYLIIAARILTGKERVEIDRRTVLDGIAFYNFIQFMMPDINVRPTPEQARASEPAFHETVADLDPTHIIATGLTIPWWYMPKSDRRTEDLTFGETAFKFREYKTPSGFAMAIVVPHLSRQSAPKWHGPVTEFLSSSPADYLASHQKGTQSARNTQCV